MLILGNEKTNTILEQLPESYLLIDDGAVIDALTLPTKRRDKSYCPQITRLDFDKHSVNPLDGIERTDEGMVKADYFLEVLNAAFPAGAATLTKQDASDVLLHALVENKTRTISKLLRTPNPKDRGAVDAYRTIQTVLLHPVLERVLDRSTNVSLHGIVLARLNRATMGDRVCFILGNYFVNAYPGRVVIPDFGFYAITAHSQLIRQGRLIAGVNFLSDLDRLPQLRNQLLASEQTKPFFFNRRLVAYTHHGYGTTFKDAETLAEYAHLRPDFTKEDNAYNAFIAECMRNRS